MLPSALPRSILVTMGLLKVALAGNYTASQDAKQITSFAPPAMVLPEPEVTVNHSTRFWKGLEWHYRIPDPVTGDIEEFTIGIIEGSNNASAAAAAMPLTSRNQPSEADLILRELDPRQLTCVWLWDCGSDTVSYVTMTAAQLTAEIAALGTWLREDNYKNAKIIAAGQILDFVMSIVSNIAGYFITNKFQVQNPTLTDACNTTDLETMITQLQNNISFYGTQIEKLLEAQAGLFALLTEINSGAAAKEGKKLLHSIKPTEDEDDYMNISSCPV